MGTLQRQAVLGEALSERRDRRLRSAPSDRVLPQTGAGWVCVSGLDDWLEAQGSLQSSDFWKHVVREPQRGVQGPTFRFRGMSWRGRV